VRVHVHSIVVMDEQMQAVLVYRHTLFLFLFQSLCLRFCPCPSSWPASAHTHCLLICSLHVPTHTPSLICSLHRLGAFRKDLRTALAATFQVEDVPGNGLNDPIFVSAIYRISRDNTDPETSVYFPQDVVERIDTHNSSDLVIIEFDADMPLIFLDLIDSPLTYWTEPCINCFPSTCKPCLSISLFSASSWFLHKYIPHCVASVDISVLNCMAGSRVDSFSPPPSPGPPPPPTRAPPTPP
jgi:hypothetical protein